MRIVFAGTPDFAVPPLEALLQSGHVPAAVYTQPDRPAGRGRRITASPVKQLAVQHGLPVCQPVTLKTAEACAELAKLHPDLLIVVAYGLLLPVEILSIPRLGCINIHASLLPRWRGAAPIQRAILAGDAETGVCLMQMEAGLDTGPVLACARTIIGVEDSGSRLHDRLARMGARLLSDNLDALLQKKLVPRAQDDAVATYAHKLDKSEAVLDWQQDAPALARKVRAFNAWPVAETRFQGKQLRIWMACALEVDSNQPPGAVLSCSRAGVDVACGSGVLRLQQLQLPGGRAMAAAEFVNAHALGGERLGGA
jgi:methionyl-tRNA formyltransferase